MGYNIQISEDLINYIFLRMLYLDEHDKNLYLGNEVNVLKEDELKEIESHLEAKKAGESVIRIITRAIEQSSINLYNYHLPAKIKKVD